MIGHVQLPRMLDALCSSLTYHWTLCYAMDEGSPGVHLPRYHVIVKWKPVVWLCKGEQPDIDFSIRTLPISVRKDAKQKEHHPWQQPDPYFDLLVAKFTRNDQVVCDPFMGSGTTGIACKKFGRKKFIGIEENLQAFEDARASIAGAKKVSLATDEKSA